MARDFDGSTEYLTNASWSGVVSMPLTIAGWFYSDSATARQTICAIVDTATTTNLFMLEADGGAAGDPIKASQAAGGTVNSASTSTGYSTGVWTHAAAVFATTTSRTAYINGGSSGTSTSTRNNPSGLDSVSIGRLGYSTPINYLNGRTAEVGVWNAELTATEIATLAKGVSPLLVRADALVSYWPIVGRTSPEIDLMGAHPLTLTGTVQVDHPPMRYPGRVHVVKTAAAPGGSTFQKIAGNRFALAGPGGLAA